MSNQLKSKESVPFLRVVRLLFIFCVTFLTHEWAQKINPFIADIDLKYYTICGLLIALVLVFIEMQIQNAFPQELIVGLFGLLCGLSTSALLQTVIPETFDQGSKDFLRLCLHIFLGYFGITIGLRYSHRIDFSATKLLTRSEDRLYGSIVMDTSVLIDGRIIEIVEAGFINGLLVIPSFVINELQILSDSSDHLKRSKGRRGLDISKRLQSSTQCETELIDEDFPNVKEVDKKLLAFSKKYEATLLTMDYNLNKVAQIEAVNVMNINQLTQALRTVVLPGEVMNIQLIREGKEPNQGVGYLDDGTMVVVEGGKLYLGNNTDIVVSSVLQTSAGRMVFAKPQNGANKQDQPSTD
jgi:uncharacterized protein YacL